MEENNYRDEFEFFLKESADEYKMVPSRKVWYSLYNNLHPDRKWPSMAVCLLILTAVLYIGIANNNSLSIAAKKASTENFSYLLNKKSIDNKITFSSRDYLETKDSNEPKYSLIENGISSDYKSNSFERTEITKANIPDQAFLSPSENTSIIATTNSFNNNDQLKTTIKKITSTKNIEPIQSAVVNNLDNLERDNDKSEVLATAKSSDKLIDSPNSTDKIDLLNIEKSWKEDYAFRNKPAINKFKQNTRLSYYTTPSFGYRTFSKTTETGINNTASYTPTAARSGNDASNLLDNAALNLEIGAILQYSISKNIRLKTGLQANYTNYVSNVTALGHPSVTSLTINSNSNNLRSSNYSTKAGNDKINKTTMQIALPLGADYKIAGRGKLNWYVGGTLQPTYVISGNAFVLSSDEKYYVSETALLRKANLNSSIETFLSFKSTNGIIINVGPQFRYQFLSTYKKEYGYSEKVYNVGVKIGVTTSF